MSTDVFWFAVAVIVCASSSLLQVHSPLQYDLFPSSIPLCLPYVFSAAHSKTHVRNLYWNLFVHIQQQSSACTELLQNVKYSDIKIYIYCNFFLILLQTSLMTVAQTCKFFCRFLGAVFLKEDSTICVKSTQVIQTLDLLPLVLRKLFFNKFLHWLHEGF